MVGLVHQFQLLNSVLFYENQQIIYLLYQGIFKGFSLFLSLPALTNRALISILVCLLLHILENFSKTMLPKVWSVKYQFQNHLGAC